MSCCLCEDLVSEIFEKLPPKSLIRFRSLSKAWFSRISSRKFIQKHTLQSPEKYIVRHSFENENENEDSEDIYTLNWHSSWACPRIGHTDISSTKFPVGPDDYPPLIIGLSNGIFCLYNVEDSQMYFYLWNFSIRRKLTLPYQAFYELIDGHDQVYGFGFDPINDDYKFVYISYSQSEAAENTYLYSMKTDSWSEIASPTITFLDVKFREAVVLNGVLHWLVKYNLSDHIIVTFDLGSIVFGSISLPEPSWVTHRLIVYDILRVSSIKDDKIWVWQMTDYNNAASWSLVYKCDTTIRSISPIAKDCCCYIQSEIYVETLELLDRGSACGETFVPLKKENQKKENSGMESIW